MQSALIVKADYKMPGYKKAVDLDRGMITYIRGGIGYTLILKDNYFLLRKFDYLNNKILDVNSDDIKKFRVVVWLNII